MFMADFICPEQIQCFIILVIGCQMLLGENWFLESNPELLRAVNKLLAFASETEEVESR